MKPTLYRRIREILEGARTGLARSVNTAQVVANWLIGREIIQAEQKGQQKAGHGQKLITELSKRLQKDYGTGYSTTHLKLCRQFFLTYADLIQPIGHTLRDQFALPEKADC